MAGVPAEFATSQTPVITEEGPAALLAPDMVMTDADSTTYPSPYLRFDTYYQNLAVGIRHTGTGPGEIGFQNGAVTYGGQQIGSANIVSNGNMSVNLHSSASVEAIQALLRNVTVRTKGDEISGTRYVSMGFYENHSAPWQQWIRSGASIAVDTIGINDAPHLTEVEGGGTYVAGDDPQAVITSAYAKDPDYFWNAYDYATITASITQNGGPEDRLSFIDGNYLRVVDGQLYRTDSSLPRVIGTVTGGANGEPLQIKFNEAVWWEVNQSIKQIGFSTSVAADITLPREVEVVFADVEGAAAEPARVTVNLIVPTAPVLDTTLTPQLRPTREDSTTPASTEVASLLAGAVSDSDSTALGIAVTYASSDHGIWQYSLSAGQWTDMGTPSGDAALLLPDSARLRFVPKTNFNGAVSLRYRAWDQSEGGFGGVLDTTKASGGLTSVSREVESAMQTILPVNDAPELDNAASQTLFGAMEDARTPRATPVYSLVEKAVSDVDVGDRKGIAVYRAPSEHGTWQYQLTDRVWRSMGEVSESAALLLPASAHVRFVPAANFNGTVRLYYRAWDQTQGTAGGTFSLTGNLYPTGAFSTATESAAMLIEPVNDAATLTVGATLSYQRDTAAVQLTPLTELRDFDNPIYGGGELTVQITSGQSAANWLAIGSAFTIDADKNIWQGDHLIGKHNFGGGQGMTELVVTFAPQATRAQVQDLIRALTFKTISGALGQRMVQFTLTDGQGGSVGAVKVVDVVA